MLNELIMQGIEKETESAFFSTNDCEGIALHIEIVDQLKEDHPFYCD